VKRWGQKFGTELWHSLSQVKTGLHHSFLKYNDRATYNIAARYLNTPSPTCNNYRSFTVPSAKITAKLHHILSKGNSKAAPHPQLR
jgi:hypothetical protein